LAQFGLAAANARVVRSLSLAVMIIGSFASLVSDLPAGQVKLAWDPSSDPMAVGYNLYYGSASRTYTNMVSAGASTSITISNLASSGPYYFAATVIDASGLESVYSSEVVYQGGPGACLVALTNLNQVYDGAPKPVSAATTPVGISLGLTYNGSPTAPVSAGSYQVIATVTDTNYYGSATNVLTISKAAASLQLGNLNAVYSGSACQVSATTVPAGLTLVKLYNGAIAAPTNAGSYPVSAAITDPNYAGGATNLLTIAKAAATIQLGNLTQTYDGSPKSASVQTLPLGLAAGLTYNNSAATPINAGSYQVIASVADANYFGSVTNLLTVTKASASIQLAGLNQLYSGSACQVSATTVPAGLTLVKLYNGAIAAPTNAGSYPVSAAITDPNYAGGATNLLTIAKAAATIQLGNLTQTYDGSPKSASVQTLPLGLAAGLTYNNSAATPINAGSYQVIASVADANYFGSVTNLLTVTKASASIQLAGLNQLYSGSACQVSATTVPAGLTLMALYNGATAAPTNAGSYPVSAAITDANYSGSTTNVMVISKATGLIQASALNQVYDGKPKKITVTTVPSGLSLNTLYAGVVLPPTNAGTYLVVISITDSNYVGGTSNTLTIAKAAATVLLGSLAQTCDGTPKCVTVRTTPSRLTVLVTYNGQSLAPSKPGNYTVVGIIADQNYAGASTNTLALSKGKSKPLPGGGGSTAIAALIKASGVNPAERPLVLSWPPSTDGVTILQSVDLITWSTLTNVSSASSVTIPVTPPIRFFKAVSNQTNAGNELPLLIERQ
jgi:hypothetical protein